MQASAAQKKRNLSVIKGGAPSALRGRRRGPRHKTAAELVLARDVRMEFVGLVDRHGNVPSEAIQKIREGEQCPLGVFGRRIVEAHAAGCDHEHVRRIGLRIVEWIDRLYQRTDDTVKEMVYYQHRIA